MDKARSLLARYDAWVATPRARRALDLSLRAACIIPPLVWLWLVAPRGRQLSGDAPHLMGIALRLAGMIRHGEGLDAARAAWTLLAPQPPGAYLPGVLAYLALPPDSGNGVLLAGVLGLGLVLDGVRRLGGGWVGLSFVAGAGVLWPQAEQYGVDLLAAACVVQSVSHLVASEGLARRGHAAGWGAWMGAAFMVKYSAPFFLVGPCLVAGIAVLRHRRWAALGLAIAAFALVAGPWYGGHLREVLSYGLWSSDAGNELMSQRAQIFREPYLSAARLVWYPTRALEVWGWLGLLAAALGLAWPAPRMPRTARWVLGAALLLAWLLLTAQLNRQARYLLPAVPLLAALVGSSRLRWLFAPVGLMSLWCLYVVFGTPRGADYACDPDATGPQPVLGWPWPRGAACPQDGHADYAWVDDAVKRLATHSGEDAGAVGLLIPEGLPGVSPGEILYRSAVQGRRWSVASPLVVRPGEWAGGAVRFEVYVAPFATETWPSRDFATLLAVVPVQPGVYQAWMAQQGYEPLERWPFEEGWEGLIAQREPGAPPAR
ncbi:MAG: hypothetical protein ABIO70_12240 [Pseudomonadota bacterium]